MKIFDKYNDILTPKDVAEILDSSVDFIRKAARNNLIPHKKIGLKIFFIKKTLIEFLN